MEKSEHGERALAQISIVRNPIRKQTPVGEIMLDMWEDRPLCVRL